MVRAGHAYAQPWNGGTDVGGPAIIKEAICATAWDAPGHLFFAIGAYRSIESETAWSPAVIDIVIRPLEAGQNSVNLRFAVPIL